MTWPVLLIPTPWLFINQLFYATQNGLPPWRGIGAALFGVVVHLAVTGVLIWMVVPIVQRAFAMRSVLGLQLCLFTVSGPARAVLMVWMMGWPSDSGEQILWLSISWAIDAGIWTASAAVLMSWWHRAKAQRLRLESEYRRQLLTRLADARALTDTEAELDAVRASTTQALAAIRGCLHPQMSVEELTDCIDLIDRTVAGAVRPASHDLARTDIEVRTVQEPAPLWRPWNELVPSIVRSWHLARPFQAGLVGLLCVPMVLMALLVHAPHSLDAGDLLAVAVVIMHLLLLVLADRFLAPRLVRLDPQLAVSVILAVYLVMYLLGLNVLIWAGARGAPGPLEAFLVPPMLALISGGVSAFAKAWSTESAAARAVIARTDWGIRLTRQQLWARRRRLATALHGRVQANLTAAGLMLGMARQRLRSGGDLDADEIQRIHDTLGLAGFIDEVPPVTPASRLGIVAEVWRGVLTVDIELRPVGEALMERQPDLADACVEVVRELLLNAVRHSAATNVEVVIGAVGGGLLCLHVAERVAGRQPLGAVGGPGIGRTLIDSLAVDWAESDTEDGRITVAMLAADGVGPSCGDARSRLSDISMLT